MTPILIGLRVGLWGSAAVTLLACTGHIGTDVPEESSPGSHTALPGSPLPGLPPGAGMGPGSDPTSSGAPGAQSGHDAAFQRSFLRLTASEYDNTVRDLLGQITRPARAFPPDAADASGFLTAASVSEVEVQAFMTAAEEVAAAASQGVATLVNCDPAKNGADACMDQFVTDFAPRAYRRPLSVSEHDALRAFDSKIRDELAYPYQDRVRVLLQLILQSPAFLYHWELGQDPAHVVGGEILLNDFEIASRLSYALWQSMPDDELFAQAKAGHLRTTADVESQARRLLKDPRARDTVSDFHAQWLKVSDLTSIQKDPKAFPNAGPALFASMQKEMALFTSAVILDGDGTLQTLLTAPYTFADSALAAIYGLPSSSASDFPRVELDVGQRAGLLTHPAFLARHASASDSHPVKRGLAVWDRVLCGEMPAPPPNIPSPSPPAPNLSTRERFAAHSSNACAKACHALMDPYGFAFENFDAIGRYRTTDGGKPVDATGNATLPGGAPLVFHDAVELMRSLSTAPESRACLTKQWFRFGLGRHESPEDEASLAVAGESFSKSGFDIRELLVALTQTRAFFYRAPASGEVTQ